MRQRELAERSQVSQAIVREIQQGRIHRRRSARTLEALSLALEWHPDHLMAVLEGHPLPQVGDPESGADDDIRTRLTVIERRLREITHRLDTMNANLAEVIGDGRHSRS